jgi:hypothetical protein
MFSRSNWARQRWVLLAQGDLDIEHQQAVEEGRDISSVEKEFDAIKSLDLTIESNQQRAEALLDKIQTLPVKSGYAYHEPSDLAGIRNARPALLPLGKRTLSDQELLDKALGAWQGRVSGCLLGKPVEGCKSYAIEKYLKAQGRWPLNRYFSFEAPAELRKEMGWEHWGPDIFDEGIGELGCMPGDDDTNYTMAGIAVIKQNNEFSPETFGMFWLNNIPGWNLCTAERIAYKNMLMAVPPPMSASYRNVYRESVVSQRFHRNSC